MADRTGGYRSYVDVLSISNSASTGTCAALVQHYTKVGPTSNWKEGAKVRGHKSIKRGTAIATFVNGKYPNLPSSNHAALYVSQTSSYIRVVDQWVGKDIGTYGMVRDISFLGKNSDGTYKDPSNNGDALSIIEL